jgi:hypothetical protein
MLLVVNLGLKAQTNYPVIQAGTNVNNSPWYGLGSSNVTFPGVNHSAIQLAGYYGVLFKTTGGEFSLNHQGNVGIGTTEPVAKLDVRGDISIKYGNSLKVHTNWNGNGNDKILKTGWISERGNFLDLFVPGNGASAESKIAINQNGNVGIGTRNPLSKLQIAGGSNNWDESFQGKNVGTIHLDPESRSNNFGNAITFGASDVSDGEDAQAGIYVRTDGSYGTKMYFSTTDSYTVGSKTAMTIDHRGNVGIGLAIPNTKLHVRGYELASAINSQSIIAKFEGNTIGNSSKFQILNKRNTNGTTWSNTSLRLQRSIDNTPQAFIDFGIEDKASNYGLAFGTRNGYHGIQQTRMVIQENGYVGIGTTTPDSKLAVNGKIHTKEVKVDLIGWADFVFEDKYELPTLKEVENHIKEKGHLKNIPSAKDVSKNGIYLGEMNAKLLQKIEELTLYTIQQEKKIKQQEKELKKLKVFSVRLDQIEKMLKVKR